MSSGWRYWLRRRCCAILSMETVYSFRQPDVVNADGTFTAGVEMKECRLIICKRHRWHGGECRR